MRIATRKRWGVLLTAALVAQVSGCGTLFYPERKGQSKGKVDATVAILDGIGLLFFIIPGLIAFIIDFDNGTIYLPGTAGEDLASTRGGVSLPETPEAAGWTAVHVGPGALDAKAVREIVGRHTGQWIAIGDPRFVVSRVPANSHQRSEFAYAAR